MLYTDKLSEQLGPNTEINREKNNKCVSYDGASGERFNNHTYKTLKQQSLAELLFVITN